MESGMENGVSGPSGSESESENTVAAAATSEENSESADAPINDLSVTTSDNTTDSKAEEDGTDEKSGGTNTTGPARAPSVRSLVEKNSSRSSAYSVEEINQYKRFLSIVRQFPDRLPVTMDMAKDSLESIALYCEADEILNITKHDEHLREKMVRFITKSAMTLLNPIKKDIRSGCNPDLLNKTEIRESISAAFAALTNFLGVDSNMACEISTYVELIRFLYPFWVHRIYDPLESLPYGCLINMTRNATKCSYFIKSGHLKVQELVKRSTEMDPTSPHFPCLMEVLLNLSQVHEGRMQFFDRESEVLENVVLRIKPGYRDRVRLAVAGILKNLAFEEDYHHILVDENQDFLAYGLRPLLGKGNYDKEEIEGLPLLIYGNLLEDPDMPRDPNPDVRYRTIEFLFRLCSDRKTRESLRNQKVYCILREYHKAETDEELLELTEQVVNLLIQTEEEIGAESLSKLSVSDTSVATVSADETAEAVAKAFGTVAPAADADKTKS